MSRLKFYADNHFVNDCPQQGVVVVAVELAQHAPELLPSGHRQQDAPFRKTRARHRPAQADGRAALACTNSERSASARVGTPDPGRRNYWLRGASPSPFRRIGGIACGKVRSAAVVRPPAEAPAARNEKGMYCAARAVCLHVHLHAGRGSSSRHCRSKPEPGDLGRKLGG